MARRPGNLYWPQNGIHCIQRESERTPRLRVDKRPAKVGHWRRDPGTSFFRGPWTRRSWSPYRVVGCISCCMMWCALQHWRICFNTADKKWNSSTMIGQICGAKLVNPKLRNWRLASREAISGRWLNGWIMNLGKYVTEFAELVGFHNAGVVQISKMLFSSKAMNRWVTKNTFFIIVINFDRLWVKNNV